MYILFINLFFTPPKLQYIFWKIPKTYERGKKTKKIVYYTRSHIKYTVNIVLNKIINFLFLTRNIILVFKNNFYTPFTLYPSSLQSNIKIYGAFAFCQELTTNLYSPSRIS